jgi:hypothetical protein
MPRMGEPLAPRAKCAESADVCMGNRCIGNRMTCQPSPRNDGVPCGTGMCDAGSFTPPPSCGGGSCLSKPAVACDRFACDPMEGCLSRCGSDTHCAPAHVCRDKNCIPLSGSKCSPDRSKSIALDGTETACAPLLCGDDGKCLPGCKASTDCVSGYSCDVTSKTCTPLASDGDEGGCAMGSHATNDLSFVVLALLGLSLARRTRR